MNRVRYYCPIHGGWHDPIICARCYKNANGGAMLKVKCRECGNEQHGSALMMYLPCPKCQDHNWHFRSDRYEELKASSAQTLAKLVYDLAHGKREEG